MSDNIYTHIHHIIPKHMGGSDDPDNLIELTVEEHAEAHKKLYEKYGNYKDKIAWLALSGQISSQEATRKIQSKTMKNRVYTEEIRKNMSKGQKGKKYPNRKGKCSGENNNFYGMSHTEEYKKRKSKLMKGRKLSEETKQKMSESKRGIPKPKLTCPHCGKTGGAPVMKRHHFNNCKENKNV